MESYYEKCISLILVLCFIFSCNISSYATESTEESTPLTPYFIEMITCLFEDTQNYRALDKSQNDVTDSFISKHLSTFNQKNYVLLLNAFKKELSSITWVEESMGYSRGSTTERNVSKKFYVVDETREIYPGRSFEIIWRIDGWFSYDTNTHDIIDHDQGRIFMDHFWAGDLFDARINGATVDARIGLNNKRVIFEGDTYVDLNFELELIDNLPILGTETVGPYYGSFVAYPQ